MPRGRIEVQGLAPCRHLQTSLSLIVLAMLAAEAIDGYKLELGSYHEASAELRQKECRAVSNRQRLVMP